MSDITAATIASLRQILDQITPGLNLALSEQLNQDVLLANPDIEAVSIQDLLAMEDSVLATTFSLSQPSTAESLLLLTQAAGLQIAAALTGTENPPDTETLSAPQTALLTKVMEGFVRGLSNALTNVLPETVELETATTQLGVLTLPPVFAMEGQAIQAQFRLVMPDVTDAAVTFLLVPELVTAWDAAKGLDTDDAPPNLGGDTLSEDDLAAMLNDIGGGINVAPTPAPIQTPVGNAPPFANFPTSHESALPRGMELILDIPLDVTVELGRVRMLIKDVLELSSGSIVELDRVAGEPVDLLVNGKLIAKGEVVVIEDNFGIRITEIVSPADRVAGLGKGR